jgi:hypothetical protein
MKVLATYPAQVLDGHTSLENSLMEDDYDVDGEDFLFGRRPASLTYSAVEEDVEGEEGGKVQSKTCLIFKQCSRRRHHLLTNLI